MVYAGGYGFPMSRELRVICAPDERVMLGEGPVWDDRTKTLYWVDIDLGNLHQCNADGSRVKVTRIGERLGCVALRANHEGFIAGLEHRIGLLSLNPLSIETLSAPEREQTANRCNDGKCDPRGRFWVGTSNEAGDAASGWLYRIDPDSHTARTAGPFICTNGPQFSPDGNTLYCVDTYGKTIYSYRMDGAGELFEKEVFVRFDNPAWGYPDGLTCDVHGCLWVAHWAGARVSRFSPRGDLLESIELPVSQITSCTFGGVDLRTLFITSASVGLEDPRKPGEPAGALFAVDLDVGGLPAARYSG
jgi:sugar lactone lactonase YvrE